MKFIQITDPRGFAVTIPLLREMSDECDHLVVVYLEKIFETFGSHGPDHVRIRFFEV